MEVGNAQGEVSIGVAEFECADFYHEATIYNRDAGHAKGWGYWLTRLMGASLRSFTHPTKNRSSLQDG
ncbi:MAG TPA: hypothetical protein DCO71_10575 [Gammaproteobacteria bacterium]|nr:hypothetical protein [Gammaproteobacteria bacterium]